MKVDIYIRNNFPFYHLTKMDNLEYIMYYGLRKSMSKSRSGICVVRTLDEDVINEIIDCQLHTLCEGDDTSYALLKITPKKHGITADVVAPDPISERNNSLYNYLCVDTITIDESDVIKRDLKPGRVCNAKILKDIIELEDYHITAP